MAVEISKDKAPAGVVAAVRTDGRKIPYEAAGTESIGDVIERDAATQAIGVVTDVGWQYLNTATAKAANPSPVLAAHRDDIQLQITGLIYAPFTGTASDGAALAFSGGSFAANATGAHLLVGDTDGTQTHAVIDINVVPRAAT